MECKDFLLLKHYHELPSMLKSKHLFKVYKQQLLRMSYVRIDFLHWTSLTIISNLPYVRIITLSLSLVVAFSSPIRDFIFLQSIRIWMISMIIVHVGMDTIVVFNLVSIPQLWEPTVIISQSRHHCIQYRAYSQDVFLDFPYQDQHWSVFIIQYAWIFFHHLVLTHHPVVRWISPFHLDSQ